MDTKSLMYHLLEIQCDSIFWSDLTYQNTSNIVNGCVNCFDLINFSSLCLEADIHLVVPNEKYALWLPNQPQTQVQHPWHYVSEMLCTLVS